MAGPKGPPGEVISYSFWRVPLFASYDPFRFPRTRMLKVLINGSFQVFLFSH